MATKDDPEQVLEECKRCGNEVMGAYLEDNICPECRGE